MVLTDPPSVDVDSDTVGIHAHTLVHGTIDASGDIIEVYFDAAEEHVPCRYDDRSSIVEEFDTTPAETIACTTAHNNALDVRGGALAHNSMDGSDHDAASLRTASSKYYTPRQSFGPDDHGDWIDMPPPPPQPPQAFHCYPDYLFPPPPLPPVELPTRFLRAGKGDPVEGQRRYEATLQWRRELGMDTILQQPNFNFELIKQHYPHFFHFKGRHGEPVFYELPPKTNLKALRNGGVTVPMLLRHYAMVTEFGWQYLEQNDFSRSIYIIDLDGIKLTDFVGECVDFVRKASEFTGAHYPERAGSVIIINVPSWFKLIWNVVKAWIDEVTLKKICILRGQDEIREALSERIPLEFIPSEYGGTCQVPLGQSPEEELMWSLMRHNNLRAEAVANGGPRICNGCDGKPPCHFCSFCPVRSY
jgi:hypothetical protein